jgi:predicted  nucleic acid-binding Zn-ribbon protein
VIICLDRLSFTRSNNHRREALIAELSQLVALQETDIEIKRCREEVAALPLRQGEIERQFEASVKEFLDLKQQFEEAAAERRRLEDDLAEEQRKHEKFKADLMKATNEKEYTTAVREIDATKKTVGTLETEVLKLMEKVEKRRSKSGRPKSRRSAPKLTGRSPS